MNKILKAIKWKTISGRLDIDEILFDIITILIFIIGIYIGVIYAK